MNEHATIPSDRLFWAVLEPKAVGSHVRTSGRRNRQRLGYLFEEFLPIPIDDLHAVYAPLGGDGVGQLGGVVCCGIQRDSMAEFNGRLTLRPESVPGFIGSADVTGLNLLVHEFEPVALRTARARAVCIGGLLLSLTLVILGVGLARRADHHTEHRLALDVAIDGLYAEVLPPGTNTQPPALRMTGELRRLRQTTNAGTGEIARHDASVALAALLSAWPDRVHARTDSLTASRRAMTVTVLLPDPESAEALIDAIEPPEGWQAAQPAMTNRTDGVELRLSLAPKENGR